MKPQKNNFTIPELLAPAGNLESIQAVVQAGADAVYFGTKAFNMRQHRPTLNLERQDMPKAIQICHENHVKAYVTFNSLLGCHEIKDVYKELEFLVSIQPDSIIIQDISVISMIRALSSSIPIHASTMMNVHNSETVKILAQMGISRIITSRDITLEDVKKMAEETDLEMEYFIHGDMCVAESGQCYQSSVTFGESSNRGRCMKPCRWRYDLIRHSEKGEEILARNEMLLARKDMCLLEHIPELIKSKIVSLKIEGRARSSEYLAKLIAIYRRELDRVSGKRKSIEKPDAIEDRQSLYDMRIRDFSTCFAFGRPGEEGIAPNGKREPRIFSIAKSEPLLASPKNKIIQGKKQIEKLPKLLASVSHAIHAARALENGIDIVSMYPQDINELQKIYPSLYKPEQIRMKTPRILTDGEMKQWIDFVKMQNIDSHIAIEINDIGLLTPLKREGFKEFHAGYSLNILNHISAKTLAGLGFSSITSSFESGWENLMLLAELSPIGVCAPVHGLIPGMIVDYCLAKEKDACKKNLPDSHWILRDTSGGSHGLICEYGCRVAISTATDLCMLPWLSEFLSLGLEELKLGLEHYTDRQIEVVSKIYSENLKKIFQKREMKKEELEDDLESLALCASRPLGVGAYSSGCFHISEEGKELEKILIKEAHI